MNKTLKIKELRIDENDTVTGVNCISFVDNPAIEANFQYFKYDIPELLPFFKFTAYPEPELIPTSHPFCREHAGHVYHTSEIQEFSSLNHGEGDYYATGWIQESNYFQNFDGNGSLGFNGNSQLYNCRHNFVRVTEINQVPRSKWHYLNPKFTSEKIYLSIENEEKRIISGPILISGKMIYRNSVDSENNPGYVYFSRDTVRKIQKKYGLNRKISLAHQTDITGHAIMIKSYLKEDEETNTTTWYGAYQCISDQLWDFVKSQKVVGYSIEALFNM